MRGVLGQEGCPAVAEAGLDPFDENAAEDVAPSVVVGNADARGLGRCGERAAVEDGRHSSLSPFFNGERARVRGGDIRRRWSLPPPLTPTLSPQAGRGSRREGREQIDAGKSLEGLGDRQPLERRTRIAG